MKHPHVTSALAAVLITGAILAGWANHASAFIDGDIHALTASPPDEALQSSALLRSAFRQPDLLPVLGSSELLWGQFPYRASEFFTEYPTGFDVFVVAKSGVTPLVTAQELAGVGRDLRGKKVVIALTPLLFYHPEVKAEDYAGNFSRLHADELAFSTSLSFDLKRIAARRMLAYPDTLAKDALLRFALHRLTEDGLFSRILYYAALPLGRLETLALRWQDQREVMRLIQEQPGLKPAVAPQPHQPDWSALAAQAEQEQAKLTQSNPYGVENSIWFDTHKAWVEQTQGPGSKDADYLQHLQDTQEWTDLNILLRLLKEQGARPLIVCLPFKGPLLDALGVSADARQQFYASLEGTVAVYGFPLVDYRQYDGDPYFVVDMFSHTSREGWIYVDQTLDAYFHGALR